MSHLEEVSIEQLRDGLDAVDDKKAALRLIVGINYKYGISQTELAEWYDVSPNTIRNWIDRLKRLESEPIEDVVHDAPRSGRPSKLTDSEHEQLESVLQEPPSEIGIDAPHWSPPLVQAYVDEEFDAEYTLRHIRDLMNDAGIVWKTGRPELYEGDERAREAFKQGFKKTDANR